MAKYTDTPCGRAIAAAEYDLGYELTDKQSADLLLDNFTEIANFEEALAIVKDVTIWKEKRS